MTETTADEFGRKTPDTSENPGNPGNPGISGNPGDPGPSHDVDRGTSPGAGISPGHRSRDTAPMAPVESEPAHRAVAPEPGGSGEERLLPADESDKLGQRLRQAVGTFVDSPRDAVQEADLVVEEAAAHLTEALAARQRALKESWVDTSDADADTERLRLALKDYRATAERLLNL
ncbi:hypothetical protein AB0C59_07195 [Streptomyces sp. NPDC048664]|uniref:hypothetical protein n=1 Tax=Streptomyces sp. NPDC048664 TaxID=3154505 RepID=UPI00341B21B2